MKIVNYPIKVPSSRYCWYSRDNELCQFFDNEGGHSSCDLDFYDQKDHKNGVLKPKECLELRVPD